MVSFKIMWEDVKNILETYEELDMNIVETYNSGFTVKENDTVTFVTRDDFVDFWCKLLYYKEVSMNLKDDKYSKDKYIYTILKKLPYVNDNQGILKMLN